MGNKSVLTQEDYIEHFNRDIAPYLGGGGKVIIPVGTVWQGLAATVPDGYLACDGTEYLKTDYPALAEHLAALDTLYETTLYVGTDSDHFKVPDWRGEFFRMTGTNSHTNQGSGANPGIHQDATEQPNFYTVSSFNGIYRGVNSTDDLGVKNADVHGGNVNGRVHITGSKMSNTTTNPYYSARPTNTSLLVGIKY